MMDEREFERRARACTQKLFRICYTILPDSADRDDAIQEALIKAWRKRSTLRETAYFETWLVRISINECKSILRRKKRNATLELLESVPTPEPELPDSTLHNALHRLDVKLRLPLELHYCEGYTLDEVSKLTGVPLGTLKYRMRQARLRLKDELEKGGYER